MVENEALGRIVSPPTIVLVEPQLGENIGAAARAMANFGLTDLRIVNPRDGWPSESARRAASRADHVLDAVRVFDSLTAAVADLRVVLATTARPRTVDRPVLGPVAAMARLRASARQGLSAGILFGRERTGLTNEEMALAEAVLTLPVDPTFASLNVAQAVLVTAYEWRRGEGDDETRMLPFGQDSRPPADKAELLKLFEHLESALDTAGFFRPAEKRPGMVLALRAMLSRAGLSGQEVKTLRGVVAALEGRPTRPHRRADGSVSTAREPEQGRGGRSAGDGGQ
ncbi:MAG: RNA methyltransferase [Bauldia sp.]